MYDTADEECYIDLKNLYMHCANNDVPTIINLKDDYTFECTIGTKVGDVVGECCVSGKINILKVDKENRPIEIEIILTHLPVPIDFGVVFVKDVVVDKVPIVDNEDPEEDPKDDPEEVPVNSPTTEDAEATADGPSTNDIARPEVAMLMMMVFGIVLLKNRKKRKNI